MEGAIWLKCSQAQVSLRRPSLSYVCRWRWQFMGTGQGTYRPRWSRLAAQGRLSGRMPKLFESFTRSVIPLSIDQRWKIICQRPARSIWRHFGYSRWSWERCALILRSWPWCFICRTRLCNSWYRDILMQKVKRQYDCIGHWVWQSFRSRWPYLQRSSFQSQSHNQG